jgi:hypothetical protein
MAERQQATNNYFFLPAVDFAATTAFFLAATLLTLALFWVLFFWFDLGDLSPIIFYVSTD